MRLRTKCFGWVLALCVSLLLTSCGERSPQRNVVIGIVIPDGGSNGGTSGFKGGMKELGYVEGENVFYKSRMKEESDDDALKRMIADKVDLIFTRTTPITRKAIDLTKGTGIPVVFIAYDAVESGLAKGLVRHNAKMAGVQIRGSAGKALEWLRTIVPEIRNIWVPIAYDTAAAALCLQDLKKVAAKLSIKVSVEEFNSTEELRDALREKPEGVDSIFIPHSVLINSNIDLIIKASKEWGVPTTSTGHDHHQKGILVYFGPSAEKTGVKVAKMAHRLLSSDSTNSLAIETADFWLGINLATARDLKIEIPHDVLLLADDVSRLNLLDNKKKNK